MAKSKIITEDQLDLMHFIQHNKKVTHRLIAKEYGLSIGKVNYCLQALVKIGFVKIHNFKNSRHKIGYTYLMTAKGIKEKKIITKKFIAKKQQEYDKLMSYIDK